MLRQEHIKFLFEPKQLKVSAGACAYHEAVVNAGWHKQNINYLIELVKDKIESDVVIDFGAGTGASAVYLLSEIPVNFNLILMDNSPSWLGKAYELLINDSRVKFYILPRKGGGFTTPDEVLGIESADQVISANTVHLIPKIQETFKGIYNVLKKRGSFTFQSGNILNPKRDRDVLMIDDTVSQVHDLAIKLIQTKPEWTGYRKGLDKRIIDQGSQRKFVFPKPRTIKLYVNALTAVGFKEIKVTYKQIRVDYVDWLNFLRVRRLQAGILPEVGGKDATEGEEKDRDILITKAAKQLFEELKANNTLAKKNNFIAEWTYVTATK